ncbi:MAG: outer membrane protein transport protein [Tannerella sp.]|jgi:long-subunit fatty acid transport protein|nr:outer membrane protein transport protein [Tannerella sp.]
MSKKEIYIGLLLLCSGIIFAQGEMDAFRFSQTNLNGTARSMSMGGAFGALGGDMSAMSHNPAGIGIYRSSEVQTTLNLNSAGAKATWDNINSTSRKTNFDFDNFSYVGYFPTGQERGVKSWNIGLSFNRVMNFNRRYVAEGRPLYSMADYVASQATNAYGAGKGIPENDLIYVSGSYDPYNNNELPWLPILGYESGFIGTKYNNLPSTYYSAFGQWEGNDWRAYSPDRTTLRISESGSVDEYNFSLSTNISDRIFLGATLAVTSIEYRMASKHDEDFGDDYLYMDNSLETEGTGYSVNVGLIARPTDALRLGIAYNSPKWYRMTDYYIAEAGTSIAAYDQPEMEGVTPEMAYTEYSLRTPGRWIFSAAGIIGNMALISADYELKDYKTMFLSDREGYGYGANSTISEDFGISHTFRLGAEVKPSSQFAVRAGYVLETSPMKHALTSGEVEVLPVGTVTHYTTTNQANYITLGLGYRFSPNFYMDLAYIHRTQKMNLYPFSNVYYSDPEPIQSNPAEISSVTSRFALTLGYKF